MTGPVYPTGNPYPPAYYYPRNDLGVWSLVLGIAGLVLGCVFFTGVPAVVVGMRARRAVAEGQANNPGLATAGIVLGWISIGLGVVAVLAIIPLIILGIALPFAFTTGGTGG